MAAWDHQKVWDEATINEYGARCTAWYVGTEWDLLDCATMAVELLVKYASQHGLPVVLVGDSTYFDSRTFVGDTRDFLSQTERKLSAHHLWHPSNTRFVGREPSRVRAGHLIFWLTNGRATHVQVVTRVSRTHDWISIVQGNQTHHQIDLRSLLTGETRMVSPPQSGQFFGHDPSGSAGRYSRSATVVGRRVEDSTTIRQAPWGDSLEVKEWNFYEWNRPWP